jgi:squalene cyclase
MKDKDKAQIIRKKKTYVLEDINQDGTEDMVWYDNYNIYIKYS